MVNAGYDLEVNGAVVNVTYARDQQRKGLTVETPGESPQEALKGQGGRHKV